MTVRELDMQPSLTQKQKLFRGLKPCQDGERKWLEKTRSVLVSVTPLVQSYLQIL